MQKHQTFTLNILPYPIIRNLIVKYLKFKYKRKNLVDKSGVYGFISNFDLDKEIAALATKAELKAEQDKIVKFQAFDSRYVRSKNHFEDDGTQNYLVSQAVYRYS